MLKISNSEYLLWYVCLFICLSLCLSAWNSSAPTGLIFIKYDIGEFLKKLSGKFKFN